MPAIAPLTYSVEAYNLSQASENKIHDDAVAQKLGFTGGLVPGVEVFAYMTHPAVQHWGQAWLEHGTMHGGFLKPLYDGRTAIVSASSGDNGGLSLRLDSDGIQCATASAALAPRAQSPSLETYEVRLPPTTRPPTDEASLAIGTWLATKPAVLTQQRHDNYLRDVRERHEIYARDGIAHPGLLLRLCNSLLVENVVLSPWIHTASTVQNFALAHVGDELSARARVVRNFEHKGHRMVDLDAVVVTNQKVIVAQVLHTAIYKLRHLQQ